MAIDGSQDQHRKSEIARDLDLLSNEHFDTLFASAKCARPAAH
jgi:hypothetical protein